MESLLAVQQPLSCNWNNQITNTGFAYDGNGNPTTYNGTSLSFEAENNMTAFGTALTAGYRADGLRAWKQPSGGSKTYFLYDGITPVCEIDSNGNVTATNTFGANGLLSRTTSAGTTYYTFDQQGSPAQRLDGTGAVIASSSFDAYGNRASTDNSTDPYSGYGAQWGYYSDAETGLVLCGHRYYDPNGGRFINRDPIGFAGGINIYHYVGDNPINMADPLGLDFVDDAGDFFAGWGDTLTFGATKWGRLWVGGYVGVGDANTAVDYGSGLYGFGEGVGTVQDFLFGGAGGLKAAGEKAAGLEFSHAVPARVLKRLAKKLPEKYRNPLVKGLGKSRLNGNYVTPERHYMHDPFRFPKGYKDFGPRLPVGIQQLDRVPRTIYGGLLGGALGAGHAKCGSEAGG